MPDNQIFCLRRSRAVTRVLIGGGGVYIHIFVTNFLLNQLFLTLISKEIGRTEHEYINIHLPPEVTLYLRPASNSMEDILIITQFFAICYFQKFLLI